MASCSGLANCSFCCSLFGKLSTAFLCVVLVINLADESLMHSLCTKGCGCGLCPAWFHSARDGGCWKRVGWKVCRCAVGGGLSVGCGFVEAEVEVEVEVEVVALDWGLN